MSLAWPVAMIAIGLSAAIWGSRVAVRHASILAAGSRIPPFVVGLTLVALGTDLPEIANSVAASIAGHGDLNLGDSVGSTVTQVTLVLGLVPFLAAGFAVSRRSVVSIGTVIVIALAIGVGLIADGFLARTDGLALVALWVVGSLAVWRFLPKSGEPELPLAGGVVGRIGRTVGGLVVVGGGAAAAVQGLIELSSMLAVPEYVVSFFGTALGTSLPELVVVSTAIRRGDRELAIGDAFGASLADSTLSIGAGPLVAPVAVTASLAVRGSLVAIGAVAVVIVCLAARQRHDRLSGTLFILTYLAAFPLLLR